MSKMKCSYGGVDYNISKDLMDVWMEREGLTEGTSQFENAIACVTGNAMGRLKLQGGEATKEAIEQVMEEIIKEEIELTGGSV